MQTLSQSKKQTEGYALLITMVFLGVTLMVFASMMYWITSNATQTTRNNLFNTTEAVAEGTAETAMSQMDRDFLYQSLNNVSTYEALIPGQTNASGTSWPIKYKLTNNVTITPLNWSTNWTKLYSSQFDGLYAYVAQCAVVATATPLNQGYNNLSATVTEQFQLASIPVFQFGVFYNMDLDIIPGATFTMAGKVFANGYIWMCPGAASYFSNSVSATLSVTNADDPDDQQDKSPNASFVHYATLTGGNPLSGVDSLTLPVAGSTSNNQTNTEAILNLPPAGQIIPADAAYNSTNQVYLYNEADLIISNSATGINGNSGYGSNISVYYSADKSRSPRLTLITNDIMAITGYTYKTNGSGVVTIKGTNYYCGYSFVTNVTFYDFRESATVQAVQIDVSKFNLWYTNQATRATNFVAGYPWNLENGGSDGAHGDKGHPIDSIYVYNSVPITSSQLPSVRVVNGATLPSAYGLTVATAFPIYVLGNYNVQTNGSHSDIGKADTAYTYPAALMGDSITILSSSWNDNGSNYIAGGSEKLRVPVSTTVNAACLEGIVQSCKDSSGKHYSGGLENFLRLEENWGGTLTYNGSIVVMFPSIYATNYWQVTGAYYSAPTRKWGFDANFQNQAKLPPLTPQVKQIVRGEFENYTAN